MKKILITLLLALPMMAAAQDNTWERIETEPVSKANPDAKYLVENAVPVVDGKVTWKTTINAPGKSAQQIYDILLAQLNKMVKEENQLEERSKVAIQDQANHQLGATFHEWLVFKNTALSLDRTVLNFQLIADCSDGKADVQMTRVSYDYELERDPTHYTILNLIFMIVAVVGVVIYLTDDRTKGIIVILIAMCFKMAEASMRMFNK